MREVQRSRYTEFLDDLLPWTVLKRSNVSNDTLLYVFCRIRIFEHVFQTETSIDQVLNVLLNNLFQLLIIHTLQYGCKLTTKGWLKIRNRMKRMKNDELKFNNDQQEKQNNCSWCENQNALHLPILSLIPISSGQFLISMSYLCLRLFNIIIYSV